MITNWDRGAWMFDCYGSCCVIYIQKATLDDWEKVITFLNENDSLVFEVYNYEDFDPCKTANQIDREFVFQWLNNPPEIDEYYGEVHLNLNGLEFEFFFELKDQMELRLQAGSVKSINDYKIVESLMMKLSTLLNRMVLMAYEGEVEFPLIKVDVRRGMIKVIDKKQYENRFETLRYRIKSFYFRFLQRFFRKKP